MIEKTVIICHGPSLQNSNMGDYIDSFKYILRFPYTNNWQTPQDYGKKTSYFCATNSSIKERLNKKIPELGYFIWSKNAKLKISNFCKNLIKHHGGKDVTDLIECFEEITSKHGMEKIKTIGDEYMATAGLLLENNEPLISAINCGLEMSSAAPKLTCGWQVKVGVAVGPVVAGILGRQKYQFDLWGNSVNMAARMTSLGHPGVVTVTKDTWDKVSDDFHGDSLGIFDVKGKGKIEVIACKHK